MKEYKKVRMKESKEDINKKAKKGQRDKKQQRKKGTL